MFSNLLVFLIILLLIVVDFIFLKLFIGRLLVCWEQQYNSSDSNYKVQYGHNTEHKRNLIKHLLIIIWKIIRIYNECSDESKCHASESKTTKDNSGNQSFF